MNRTEAIVLSVGFGLLVVAVSAVEWRLGLALLGIGLMASVLELPRVRQ